MDFISERHDIQYQPVYTRKSETHIRQADTLSDVVVPGLQALITGALSCMAAAAIAYPLKLSFVIPVGAFAAGFAAMWFWRMREHSKLLRAVETITHHDLDHDGFVGQPPVPEPRRSFNITLTEKAHGGSRTRIIEVPVSDDAFAQFARAALEDRPLTHRAWAGADKPMTDGEYRKLQSILLADGLLEWGTVNGKRTVVASENGKRAMTEFVNEFDARAGDDDEQA
jgi:hypothetical protein